jgi:hypothetical protein
MKRSELVEICKKYNISSSGTKNTLEKRIEKAKFFEKRLKDIQNSEHFVYDKRKDKVNKSNNVSDKIGLHLLNDNLYIHNTLHFVFDKNTKRVVGKFNNISDKIEPLTKNDLNICQQRNFHYQIPIILKGEIQTHRIKTDIDNDDSDDEEL